MAHSAAMSRPPTPLEANASQPPVRRIAPTGGFSTDPDLPSTAQPSETAARFGTFGGVFTPSVLTILGVVMYLRLGTVTGQSGLMQALAIVVIAHLISLATGLSVASIATDRKVGAGGAYYMISRSLGAPAGAAIGIPLFFAQALSVTFYVVGFVESLGELLPFLKHEWVRFAAGTIVNVLITGVSMRSADLAIKTQYFVMAVIGLSLVSFFTGTTADFPVRSSGQTHPDQDSQQCLRCSFPR